MSYLHAQIERITYANEETGYAVAKVHAKGHNSGQAVAQGNIVIIFIPRSLYNIDP